MPPTSLQRGVIGTSRSPLVGPISAHIFPKLQEVRRLEIGPRTSRLAVVPAPWTPHRESCDQSGLWPLVDSRPSNLSDVVQAVREWLLEFANGHDGVSHAETLPDEASLS